MAYAIIRTVKISTNAGIGSSLDHNYRERPTENADAKELVNNTYEHLTKNDAYQAIQDRLPDKIRKNGVRCIEYMITASPDFFKESDRQKQDEYFQTAKDWLVEQHGKENVVTTSVHRDETSPHLIAYVVPMAWNEKKQKDTLNCKHFLGGRQKLSEMQTDFHKQVQHFGLERGVKGSVATHQTVKEFYAKIEKPTPLLSEVSDMMKFDDIQPKLFESKSHYGDRIANKVWNTACDELEHVFLKGSVRNYQALERKVVTDKQSYDGKINELTNKLEQVTHEKDEITHSHEFEMAMTISKLSEPEKEIIESMVNDMVKANELAQIQAAEAARVAQRLLREHIEREREAKREKSRSRGFSM